jgi:hypothetical protein
MEKKKRGEREEEEKEMGKFGVGTWRRPSGVETGVGLL